MAGHLIQTSNHLTKTPSGHLANGCNDPACYVIPRDCITDRPHPNGVIQCVSSLFVFSLADTPSNCWYADAGFITLPSIPVGYTLLNPGMTYVDCNHCESVTPTPQQPDCCLSLWKRGTRVFVDISLINFDPATCPGIPGGHDSISLTYTGSGYNWIDSTGTLRIFSGGGLACGMCFFANTYFPKLGSYVIYMAGDCYSGSCSKADACDPSARTQNTHNCYDHTRYSVSQPVLGSFILTP